MKNISQSGLFLVLVAGVGFGLSAPFAAFSYTQGGDVFGYMLVVRAMLAAGMIALCRVDRKSLHVERSFAPVLALTVLIFTAFTFLHFQAIASMPVQLVTMIIFLYPLILSVFSIALDRTIPSRIFYASAILALAGLYLVLGPQADAINVAGSVMALAAAILIAIQVFINGRILKNYDPEIFGAQLMAGSFVIYLLAASIVGAQFPQTAIGWAAVVVSGLVVLAGQVAFFRAIAKIGGLQTGLFLKIEPVVTILAASLLLGESMIMAQLLGAMLVIAALILNSFDQKQAVAEK